MLVCMSLSMQVNNLHNLCASHVLIMVVKLDFASFIKLVASTWLDFDFFVQLAQVVQVGTRIQNHRSMFKVLCFLTIVVFTSKKPYFRPCIPCRRFSSLRPAYTAWLHLLLACVCIVCLCCYYFPCSSACTVCLSFACLRPPIAVPMSVCLASSYRNACIGLVYVSQIQCLCWSCMYLLP